MDVDSPWGDSTSTIEEVEWTKLSSGFENTGYREGITAGKESALQAGFDEGFATIGAPLGRQLGLLRGFASALLSLLSSNAPIPGPTERETLVEEARAIANELGNIRYSDLAPRDLEAEKHAREHMKENEADDEDEDGDVDVVADEEIQEKREMESLEDMMARISAGAIPAAEKSGRPSMQDVDNLFGRLKTLASSINMSIPEDAYHPVHFSS